MMKVGSFCRKKVFHKDSYPDVLVEVGKLIARNCQGLPLVVFVIDSLLGRTEKKLGQWKQVSQILSFQIFADPERQCVNIVKLQASTRPPEVGLSLLWSISKP